MQINRDFIVDVLKNLVQINSVNPSLSPSGPGERDIADYTAGVLEGIGLDVAQHEPEPGRISVVGVLPGSGQGRSLMLNAHYDTVGVEEMPEPFSGAVRGGKLYGRGAFDMKGALAACIGAVKALADGGHAPAGDVLVAAVADEEYASLGTADLIARYALDGAIVTEPTQLDVCLAHKGFVWTKVETFGRAAHGSRFEEGVDANMRMGRFLAELDGLEQDLRGREPHPLVGPPSLHAATISGGTEVSMYAAHCELHVERRTVPGETAEQVDAEYRALLDRLTEADPAFEARMETYLVRQPFEVAREASVVQAVASAARNVLGREPRFVGDTPWMDSALLAAAGVETVVIGPAGAGAHSKEEWVDVDSVHALAEILANAALDYCGGAPG